MDQNKFAAKRERPGFSSAYGINPKQKKGLLAWEWVSERMHNAHNYWIASTRADGRPHVAPVWGVYLDDVVYFGTSETSLKARNLLHNTFCVVHLESGDETVIFEGKASVIKDRETLGKISNVYGKKYPGYEPPPEFEPGTIVFAIKPVTVFAWQEADFLNTPTRWTFTT